MLPIIRAVEMLIIGITFPNQHLIWLLLVLALTNKINVDPDLFLNYITAEASVNTVPCRLIDKGLTDSLTDQNMD
jgi:hypothetical protein